MFKSNKYFIIFRVRYEGKKWGEKKERCFLNWEGMRSPSSQDGDEEGTRKGEG